MKLACVLVLFCFAGQLYGQKNITGKNFPEEIFAIQDTSQETGNKGILAEPDTNFTWEKYGEFLKQISDKSKYTVLPLNEFKNTTDPTKIVIGLRHDVDNNLSVAYDFSETEYNLGFRSTYYILHSAAYYLANSSDLSTHTGNILPILKKMQDERKLEIGWHNDLVTLQVVYNIDPVSFLHNELSWLRSNGIRINGTASHGSPYCYVYKYLNYYFFEECTFPVTGQFVNNINIPVNGVQVPMKKGRLSDFGLDYEAYFLGYNKAFSDATITNGIRWNISMLDLSKLTAGDRVMILLHPIHWHKASTANNISSFRINGQRYSTIDYMKNEITVEMPGETDLAKLIATFVLSPGAIAKISGSRQTSGVTVNNFTTAVNYDIYAENRDILKQWKVTVKKAELNQANFISFSLPGMIGAARIDTVSNTIGLDFKPEDPVNSLKASFILSQGARAMLGDVEQISDVTTNDFYIPLLYTVISKDNLKSKQWIVNVRRFVLSSEAAKHENIIVYPNPTSGLITIDFKNIFSSSGTMLEIYNISGSKVYSRLIERTGDFTFGADLSYLSPGIYFLKYSRFDKPLKIVIKGN